MREVKIIFLVTDSASFHDLEETALASFLLDATFVERTWCARVETLAVKGLDKAVPGEVIVEISALGSLSAMKLGGQDLGRDMSPFRIGFRVLSPSPMVVLILVPFPRDCQDCFTLALLSGGMDSC